MPTPPRPTPSWPGNPTALLVSVLVLLSALPARLRATQADRTDTGSVTLEQVAIAAGLLAVAIAAVAVIGKAVTNYTNLLD